MKHLVLLLEERSAEEMLKGVLPNLLPDWEYRCIPFDGKQDLEKNIVKKIRSYRVPDSLFVILRDQDSGDCRKIKNRIASLCEDAGKPDALIRIACHELESWYLADLEAVEQGLGIVGLKRYQNKKKYRNPYRLSSPSAELEKLTKGIYQKISGSRAIGPFLHLANERSNSFRVFISGLKKIAGNERSRNEISII